MTTIKDFIKSHSLAIYFILVFIISWGAILVLVGINGLPAHSDQIVMLGMAMLLGPSIAGILLTGLANGRVGFRELLSRLLKWRVSTRWYAVALLTAPFSTAVVLLALSFFSSEFAPSMLTSVDRTGLVLMGIIAGLMVAFFEELGWTGFAIPRMKQRYSVFVTGLIVGILWGAWHFLPFWESNSFSAAFPFALLLARLFSWLPAYRILMVWVYDHTESLLLVMLMHMSLVATTAIIDPSLTGQGLLTFILVRAAVLWIIVAVVNIASNRQFATSRVAQTP